MRTAGPPISDADFTLYDAAGNIILLVETPDLPSQASDFVRDLRQRALSMRLIRLPEMYLIIHGDERTGRSASFFNPDLTEERFCGNALRSVAHLAARKWGASASAIHTELGEVQLFCESDVCGISLPLDVISVQALPGGCLVDVGTPHRVEFVDDLASQDVVERGMRISTATAPVNATFVERGSTSIRARIFERGVGETRSCGSGAIAAALAVQRQELGAQDMCHHPVAFFSGERLDVTLDFRRNRVSLAGRAHCVMERSPTPAGAAKDFSRELERFRTELQTP